MLTTFRAKLLLIVSTVTLSLLLASIGSMLIGLEQDRELADVEGRLVPRLELGPRLEAEFERLGQSLQDAVAAQDRAALATTVDVKARLFDLVGGAGSAVDPSTAAALRWAIQDYYSVAHGVSARLIDGETGERLVDDIAQMQALRTRAAALIKKAAGIDRHELTAGFAAAREANRRADRFRSVVLLAGVVLLLSMSLWMVRGSLRTLRGVSLGLERFATGDFGEPIPVLVKDELGALARDANLMAESLSRLAAQRDRNDWLRAGLVGFAEAIRGGLEPRLTAERALGFLSERIGARVAALYAVGERGQLSLVSSCALDPLQTVAASERGGALLAQALRVQQLTVIDDPPAGYLTARSGLGQADPNCVVIVPLLRSGKAIAVAEFALFRSCSEATRELLNETREALAIALESAWSRAALHSRQAELHDANEELEAQRQALSEQNLALDEAHATLQEKVEELARVSAYKSQFLANMSHDLRTPLNSMLLLSHLLAENPAGNLSDQQVLHCRTIHSAGLDLLGMINQVLDLAKIEAGKQELNLGPLSLSELAGHMQDLFEPLARQKQLELSIELEPELPSMVQSDRQRVERILTNLLGNAIKFTEHGSIALRIARPASSNALPRGLAASTTIALSVSDTGLGIPRDAQERVFVAFEQAHTAQAPHGTGLGLSISRESARLLGGELVVESEPGRGSTFTCYLPERPLASASALPASVVAKTTPSVRAVAKPQRRVLLLIEDDRILAEHLADVIRASSFEVLLAATGEDGLRLAASRRPHGIILDIKLPDTDGWSVMERLRRNPLTRAIPVYFLSASDAPRRALGLGAIGYLVKPASEADLVQVVKRLGSDELISRRILVVEDNLPAGAAIVQLLAKEGVDAHQVTTAGAALAAIEQGRFGCVILDLGLPDMDGLSLLEVLKERAGDNAPRIVVNTARALTPRESRQLEAYVQAVIPKDGDSTERLRQEIRVFLASVAETPHLDDSHLVSAAAPVSLQKVKLMLAEDDMRTAYSLSTLLSERGAEVLVAENGREALELLNAQPDVHAVLMDVMMPDMDGYEAIRQLRRDRRFATLPVIALTAKALPGERERCIAAGASDYMSKPIDGDALLGTLRSWLDAVRQSERTPAVARLPGASA